MNWQQRWRELVLAGGALATSACGDQADVPAKDAATDAVIGPCLNDGLGPAAESACEQDEMACESDGGVFSVFPQQDGSAHELCEGLVTTACCVNSFGDPCCGCPEPQNPAQCAAKMACEVDGGTYNASGQSELLDGKVITIGAGCEFPSD
jgi:hypothetical protein